MKAWALAAAAVLGLAGSAGAGGFAPATVVTGVPASVATVAPQDLEWLRLEGPRMGRDVVAQVGGATVSTIEWHRDVTVRVRTESGALLSPAAQAAVRDEALDCRRGEVRGVRAFVEPNGTFVVDYDCAWLQGVQ